MDADKLLNKYIDVIEDAKDLGVAPETLSKMIWSNKTKPTVKIKVLAASLKFIQSKKNPRAALVAFIKSSDFKKAIPTILAKEKNLLFGYRFYSAQVISGGVDFLWWDKLRSCVAYFEDEANA